MSKQFAGVLLILASLYTGIAAAHSNHGTVTEQGAMATAARTVQKMTLKDLGYGVGKLDESWKKIAPEQLAVVEQDDHFYIVAVKNAGTDETVYLKVMLNGDVAAASKSNDF